MVACDLLADARVSLQSQIPNLQWAPAAAVHFSQVSTHDRHRAEEVIEFGTEFEVT